MPVSVQSRIKPWIKPWTKRYVIAKWEKAGKPVPPPHVIKQTIIEHYKSFSKYTILVETGTYMGAMVEAQRENFDHIYSIELDEALWRSAVKRFEKYKNITILCGDSGKVLGNVLQEIHEPAIFWLDGHYSGGITAKGEKECPIFEEIDAIFKDHKFKNILLIDDARLFNGTGDYPTVQALTNYVSTKTDHYQVEVRDDVIRYSIK